MQGSAFFFIVCPMPFGGLFWTLGDLAQSIFSNFFFGVTNGDNVVCCFNFEMRKVCSWPGRREKS